jgi:arginine repressor
LREYGHRAPITRLTGEYGGDPWADGRSREEASAEPAPPLVVSAGRHIPEKRVPAIPAAIAAARDRIPELRGLILGDGPDFEATGERIRELGLEKTRDVLGRPRYVAPDLRDRRDPHDALAAVLEQFGRGVTAAQNIVVVHSELGSAPAIARALDRVGHAHVVGTLAGDDTCLVITRNVSDAKALAAELDRAVH